MIREDEIWRARRVLDMVSPTAVTDWAARQLAEGRAEPALIRLASLWESDAYLVDVLLDEVLLTQGLSIPTKQQATLINAFALARDIENGVVSAVDGAREIWRWATPGGGEPDPSLMPFIAAVSEWDERAVSKGEGELPVYRREIEGYIRTQAGEFIQRFSGGAER